VYPRAQGESPNHKWGDVVSDDITDEISAEDTGGFILAGQQSVNRREYEDVAGRIIKSARPNLSSLDLGRVIDCARQEELSERELIKIIVQLLDRQKKDVLVADKILRSGIEQNPNGSFEPQSTIHGHLTALIDFGDVKTYRSFLKFVEERQIKLEASRVETVVSHLLKRNLFKEVLFLCKFLWNDSILLSNQKSHQILRSCEKYFNEDAYNLARTVYQKMRAPTSDSIASFLIIRAERIKNRFAEDSEDIEDIVEEMLGLLRSQNIDSGKVFLIVSRVVSIRKGAARALQFVKDAQDAGYKPNADIVGILRQSCEHYEDIATTSLLLETIVARQWPINALLILELGELVYGFDDSDLQENFRLLIESQTIEESVKTELICRRAILNPNQDQSRRAYEVAMRALGELISLDVVIDRALFVQVADSFKVLLPNLKGRFESLIDWNSKNQSQQVLIVKFLQAYFEVLIDSNQLHLLARTEKLLSTWPHNDVLIETERILRLAAARGLTEMTQVLSFIRTINEQLNDQKYSFTYNKVYDSLLVLSRRGFGRELVCANKSDDQCAQCIWHLLPVEYQEESIFAWLRIVSDLYNRVFFPQRNRRKIRDYYEKGKKKAGLVTMATKSYKNLSAIVNVVRSEYECFSLENKFLKTCFGGYLPGNDTLVELLVGTYADWIDPATAEMFLKVDRLFEDSSNLDQRWKIIGSLFADRGVKVPSQIQLTYLQLIPLKDEEGQQISENADKVMRVVEKSLRDAENPQLGLAECRKYLQAIGMKHEISPGLVNGSFAYFYPSRSKGEMVQVPRVLVAISYLFSSANKVDELDKYIKKFKSWYAEIHPAVWTNYLKSYVDQGAEVVDAYNRIEENEKLTLEPQKTVMNVLVHNLEWDAAKRFLVEVQETSPLKEWQLLAETLAVAAANKHQIELAEWCLGTIRNSGTQPTLKVEKAVDKAKFRLSDTDPLVSISAARQVRDQVSIMLGDIRHDLNNYIAPLQMYLDSIDSALEQLAPESEDENRHSILIRKASNSSRQKLLKIEDLIERWGTLSEAQDDLEALAGANVKSVCEDVKNLLSSELETAKVTLTVEVASQPLGKPLLVAMSAYQLDLVLRNLIKNSLRALSTADKNRIITIRAYQVEPEALESPIEGLYYGSYNKIVVYDNGHGIAIDLRKQIFDRGVTTKKERGIGRGLALVNQVVSSCGGTIEVSTKSIEEVSSADTFAQFTLTLPSANSLDLEEE
jgi:signal transduction histidine kinase